MKYFLLFSICIISFKSFGQSSGLYFPLTEDSSRYFRVTLLNQVWLRYNQSNPGTLVFGEEAPNTFDIGLRRTRIQLFGQITERAFLYFQFGQNNFNFTSSKYTGAFFHDALCEYDLFNNETLKLGAGLTIANGPSRYAQASIGTSLGLDVPVFAQSTTGIIDQFTRKLSVYARGQFKKFDYRFLISDPFAPDVNTIGTRSTFASAGHHKMYQGYVFYQFLEQESHTNPYMAGTYLGTKSLLNLGGGFVYQRDALWSLDRNDPTLAVFHPLILFAVDVFGEHPMADGGSITYYGGYFHNDYGPDYIRNVGVMNPATGFNNEAVFNGPGNSYPMMGTGEVIFVQAGYLVPDKIQNTIGMIQPYGSLMYASYEGLSDPYALYEAGLNYYLNGQNSKISFGYQNRPLYQTMMPGENPVRSGRRSMAVLQLQLTI